MKLRVGIVGIGNSWETRYRPALRALSDRFEVRAICEQVGHRADSAAKEFNAAAVHSFRALVARSDIDGVLLLDRQWFGALPILAACDAGKAIYCAVPLEADLDKAAHLKSRVDESGVAFLAELPCRHAPATLRLKELIATRLGAPRMLFCHHRQRAEKGGNGLLATPMPTSADKLTELIDWCRYVVGCEATSVVSIAHYAKPGGSEDYQMMSLDFSAEGQLGNGPVAQISFGGYMRFDWPEAVSFRPPASLQVACERGVAFVDLPTTLVYFDAAGRHMETLDSERPVGELLLSQFFRSVTSLVRNASNLEDAYRAMTIVQQAHTSQREGRRVYLA